MLKDDKPTHHQSAFIPIRINFFWLGNRHRPS